MNILAHLRGFKPLAVTPSRVVLAKGLDLYTTDHRLRGLRHLGRIPIRSARHTLARFRLFERILRLSVTSMIAVDDRSAFLNIGASIYRVDLDSGDIVLDFVIPDGRKALGLSVTTLPGERGDALVFGDYFANYAGPMLRRGAAIESQGHVNIWARTILDPDRDGREAKPDWRVLDQFPIDEIDHVHAVLGFNGGAELYALLGDTGPNVGFWKWDEAEGGFQPYAVGRQALRSTWASLHDGALLYATDTQLENNFLMKLTPEAAAPEKIAPIAGSSIYAQTRRNGVIFSSSVEPGRPSGNSLRDIFERRPGPGIFSNRSVVYSYDFETGRLAEILSAEKDWLPLRLAQFGSFMFPSGLEQLDGVAIMYGNAVKDFDDVCILVKT